MFRILITILFLLTVGCKKESLTILSGSENESLKPLLEEFGRTHGASIELKTMGSVDIMRRLQNDSLSEYDAIWPAASMWLALGDAHKRVSQSKSIMTSPVVFGIKKSLAQKLGFVGRDVTVAEILAAVQRGDLRFTMTSATQSNSGAMAYLGFLSAFAENPQTLSQEQLQDTVLLNRMTALLSGINRSSGSSGWLKELFLKGDYDAMVNYESLIIETNHVRIGRGEEPLYIVYPRDGLSISDSPLGSLTQDEKKRELFNELQEWLLSTPIQKRIAAQGRRTGLGASASTEFMSSVDTAWGISANRILAPVPLPAAAQILEALNLYQTRLRKPSLTVFCLDFSGSMEGTGSAQLKEAMNLLLDAQRSKEHLIQPGYRDITVIIPFSNELQPYKIVEGNSDSAMAELNRFVESLEPSGGTDIYSPAIQALSIIESYSETEYIPAVVLMTDGESNTGANQDALRLALGKVNRDIPIFSISFGDASQDQLDEIATMSRAAVFKGQDDLVGAFRKVKGYN